MRKAFWFTHYISFCAITTLYVYALQENSVLRSRSTQQVGREEYTPSSDHFEAAEKCQRRIAQTTAKNSPFRRYNIILDELRREVVQHLQQPHLYEAHSTTAIHEPNVQDPGANTPLIDNTRETMATMTNNTDADHLASVDKSSHLPHPDALPSLDYNSTASNMFDFGSSRVTPAQGFDEYTTDLGLLHSQGEPMGWSEFDSCVSHHPVQNTVFLADLSGIFRHSLGQTYLE